MRFGSEIDSQSGSGSQKVGSYNAEKTERRTVQRPARVRLGGVAGLLGCQEPAT